MTSRDSQTDEAGYEVLAPLSSGTYGENLLAVRRDGFGLGKLLVLRQVRRGLSADKRVRETFLDIGHRAVRLSHTNLVQTFELGERAGALFAATEHLEGEPLDAIMAAVAPMPKAVDARFWLLIASDVLSGLQYAHELRDFGGAPLALVHGGITPRKIFVTYAGRVAVTDFGLAALAAHAKRLEGTYLPEMVSYAAPEQRDGRPCDARADIYAVGLILWELLSGRRHRQTNDPHADLEPLPPLEEVKPEIDLALANVVMRAIAPDPADRWESAEALRAALQPFVDRGGIVRRSALGESIGALFARSREKIPMLLSRRAKTLASQDAYAVTLTGRPSAAPSNPPEPEEEELPFLLASPIEHVSDANVISVTELVSDSELLSSSVELIGSGPESLAGADEADIEAIPDSATPLSLADLEAAKVAEDSETRAGAAAAESAAPAATSTAPKSGPPAEHAAVPASEERAVATTELASVAEGAPASEDGPEKEAEPAERSPDSGERPTHASINADGDKP